PVDEAVLGLELVDHAAAEADLRDHVVVEDLLAAQDRDELRVVEVLAEEGAVEERRPEAVAAVDPVALLGAGEPGELELDLGLDVRVLELDLGVTRDPRQAPRHVL